MKAPFSERNVDSILKITKDIIQNSRNYHNYYINHQDTFYSNQLPLITTPNTLNTLTKEENEKYEDYKNIRKENVRSNNIPKLCPLYNNQGELLPFVATSSKINIKNLYLTKVNFSEVLANSPFVVSQRYKIFGTIGKAFEEFLKDVFFGKKYNDLVYDEKEIFDKKYDDFINETIENLKNDKNNDNNSLLEKEYLFWKNKKKMNLSLKSLNIIFEDITEPTEKPKKKEIILPFNLIPLFYLKGEELFKKILSVFIKFDENYDKFELDYDAIYSFIKNIDDEKEDNIINDIEELQQELINNADKLVQQKEDNEIYLTEPQIQKPISEDEETIEYQKKTFNIYPLVKKSSNYLNYQSFQFIWSTFNNKIYKVLIYLPLITFTIPSNSIRVNQFIDHQLFLFLLERKFQNWDFYIVNYLSSYKKFRLLLAQLASHIPINFVQYYLKIPKTKFYSFSNWELTDLISDEKRINYLLVFKPIYAYVTVINNKRQWMDKYIIHFNFYQMQKFVKIEKYLNKVLFFIKFLDICYEDNTISYNYEELDNFEVEKWVKDVQKFNIGGYFNESEEKNEKKELEFLGNTPNIIIKIEIKEPRIITRQLSFGRIDKKSYFLPYEIQKDLSLENDFLKWSFLLPKMISKDYEAIEGVPIVSIQKKRVKAKSSLDVHRTSNIFKTFTKKKDDEKLKLKDIPTPVISKVKYIIEKITSSEERKDEVVEPTKSNKIFDIFKGKKGVKLNEDELSLPILKKMKIVIQSNDNNN